MRIGLGIGLNNGHIQLGSNDSNVQTFLNITGITDPIIIAALNFRMRSFKGIDTSFNATGLNIYQKMPIDYPYVGATAATHKYNLIDARDLDVAGRISWTGSLTHNANGVTGSGINGYGNSHISPSDLGQNVIGAAFYSRTSSASTKVVYGVSGAGGTLVECYPRYTNNLIYSGMNSAELGVANSDASGSFVHTRQSSGSYNQFVRGIKSTINGTSITPTTQFISILAFNVNGGVNNYSSANLCSLTFFNQSLSDAEAQVYSAIDVQFQTMLSRNI